MFEEGEYQIRVRRECNDAASDERWTDAVEPCSEAAKGEERGYRILRGHYNGAAQQDLMQAALYWIKTATAVSNLQYRTEGRRIIYHIRDLLAQVNEADLARDDREYKTHYVQVYHDMRDTISGFIKRFQQ